MRRAAAVLVLCSALAAGSLAAQVPRFLSADAGVSRVRFRSVVPGGGEVMTGVEAGVHVRALLGAVSVEVAYGQGRLSADTGLATPRDLVNGSFFLALQPASWLALKVGPHARAYVATGGTERWMLWESRARADGAIIPGMLQVHAEGWLSLSSDVNVAPGAAGARGGEIGLTLRPPQSLVWARLGYAVDQAKLKGGARTETVEMVVLAVGVGGR